MKWPITYLTTSQNPNPPKSPHIRPRTTPPHPPGPPVPVRHAIVYWLVCPPLLPTYITVVCLPACLPQGAYLAPSHRPLISSPSMLPSTHPQLYQAAPPGHSWATTLPQHLPASLVIQSGTLHTPHLPRSCAV